MHVSAAVSPTTCVWFVGAAAYVDSFFCFHDAVSVACFSNIRPSSCWECKPWTQTCLTARHFTLDGLSPIPVGMMSHLDLGILYCSSCVDLLHQVPPGVFVWGQGSVLTDHQKTLTELNLIGFLFSSFFFFSAEGHNNKMWKKWRVCLTGLYILFHIMEFERLWLQFSCSSALRWWITAYLPCIVVTYSSSFNPFVLKCFHTRFAASQRFFSMIKPYKAILHMFFDMSIPPFPTSFPHLSLTSLHLLSRFLCFSPVLALVTEGTGH